MNTINKYSAYNVYRANVTRAGFTDRKNPDTSNGSIYAKMKVSDGQMLYLEFSTPSIVEKGLPDGMSEDGLCVEVHLHLGAYKGVNAGSWFYAGDALIGLCDARIPSGNRITHNNLPNYRLRYNDQYSRYQNNYSMLPSVSWIRQYIGGYNGLVDMTLCSFGATDPIEVKNAIENNAIVVYVGASDGYAYHGADNIDVYWSYFDEFHAYADIICGARVPEVSVQTPMDGYINPYAAQYLTWNSEQKDAVYKISDLYNKDVIYRTGHEYIGGQCAQRSSTLRISALNADILEYTIDGDENRFEVPQDVLDSGGFTWSVGVTNVLDAFSGYGKTYTITTIDSLPSAFVVAPKNTIVNASESAVFEWQHVISTGSPQSRYELQVHVGGEWQTLEEKETALTSAVIPAEQLSSTITAWRVRTANNDGVYGEFSDPASVVLIVAPHVSGVAVTGNVLPVVSWQSDDQQGYEVMVDDASTGVHYGTQKTYAWQELLADGAHTVKVRAVNRFGLFSEWVSLTHTVANAGLETAPVLTAVAADGLDAELRWTGAGYSTVHIYRDGALLDKLTGYATQYTDHTATGRHVYSVRVSDTSGNYADSAPAVADPRIRDAAIAVEGVWDWVRLVYAPGADAPQRSVSLAPVYALNYYSGRAYPAVEMSAHRSATYSVSYALDDAGDAERLRGMLGRVVVHKRRGELLRGLLQSVSEVRTCWGEEVTLSIVEVSDD